jgi:NAD(P)-dependent dehydrogenase (short-subunit alcohol dehydrogenase family)
MSHFRNGPVTPGIAFITGGARGLGNAIAVSFAKEGAEGVALVDIQDEKTFQAGKEAVEQYGAKVDPMIFNRDFYADCPSVS